MGSDCPCPPTAEPDEHVDAALAIAACERLTRSHSSTFYLGSRLFFGDRRSAVSVIYAVCRSGDDAVDTAPNQTEAAERLEDWWEGVGRAFDGRPRADAAVESGLHWLLQRFDVPLSAFEELYLGLASDIGRCELADMNELMLYCRRVAGVVGLLVAPVAGYRGGQATLDQAVALGQAMQLTNVLRDVGEDLRLGRCYLPADLRAQHGVDLAELRDGRVSEAYVALLGELLARAHALYREGWQGIPRLNGVASVAVGVAALNYEGILHKLRQNGYDNLHRRAYLRPWERLATVPRAMWAALAGGRP